MADSADYRVAVTAANRWLTTFGILLTAEVVEQLARVMINAVDEARARRQQEH